MSDNSLKVPHRLPHPQYHSNKRDRIYECKCDEKYCAATCTDDEDIENLETLKINVVESTITIDSFLVLDLLEAQCHCVNCPLKNLCKFIRNLYLFIYFFFGLSFI